MSPRDKSIAAKRDPWTPSTVAVASAPAPEARVPALTDGRRLRVDRCPQCGAVDLTEASGSDADADADPGP